LNRDRQFFPSGTENFSQAAYFSKILLTEIGLERGSLALPAHGSQLSFGIGEPWLQAGVT
jgi:hypothetical protein